MYTKIHKIIKYLMVVSGVILFIWIYASQYARYTEKSISLQMLVIALKNKSEILNRKPLRQDELMFIQRFEFIDNGIVMINTDENIMLVVVFAGDSYACYGVPYGLVTKACNLE